MSPGCSPTTFGELDAFGWATTREEALGALDHFVTDVLDTFGAYQDAMATESPFLWHGLISTALNMGLLTAAGGLPTHRGEYEAGPRAAERLRGFIRQILGWRSSCAGSTG
jgi:deoxyribodipyrimidine photolyase-related protein